MDSSRIPEAIFPFVFIVASFELDVLSLHLEPQLNHAYMAELLSVASATLCCLGRINSTGFIYLVWFEMFSFLRVIDLVVGIFFRDPGVQDSNQKTRKPKGSYVGHFTIMHRNRVATSNTTGYLLCHIKFRRWNLSLFLLLLVRQSPLLSSTIAFASYIRSEWSEGGADALEVFHKTGRYLQVVV